VISMTFFRRTTVFIATIALFAGALTAQSETAESECGNAPAIAREDVLGRLRGAASRPGGSGPWSAFRAVTPDSVQAFTDEAACVGILMAVAESESAASKDSLPLQGIVNLNDLGVVIVRIKGKVGTPGSTQSITLLDMDFAVRRYDHFQF